MAIQNKWLVNVPVATVWTSFDSAREVDKQAVENPADIESWLNSLTHEKLLGLCDQNLVQTQVLLGQEVYVLEEKVGWAHIIVPNQASSKNKEGYPGWIPAAQIVQSQDSALKKGQVAVVTQKVATLYGIDYKPIMSLSYQTVLPIISSGNNWVRVQMPSGAGFFKAEDVTQYDSIQDLPKGNGKNIVAAGVQFLGLPYLWGGMSSFGYDCSGFSYSMCRANGYTIPRDAHDQAASGKNVDLDKIEPGDLLYFAYEEGKGKIHHVGIYYGEGKLLHSPCTGKGIEIIDLKDTVYEKELCAARRYWQETGE
ncbi:NlpC/P60 family protein [Cytobacillus depressus]|uniref:NlpC/P60 family protein n=1 Tax=Cytobacillus depressus TaxID=1602942 RepID=A0A6L3V1H7_9BACI|nr:C40 family peptidase [Cytobacillus depressus]KAB2329935.1 NlpC/P60 family protein [Cytobacillus depressus]